MNGNLKERRREKTMERNSVREEGEAKEGDRKGRKERGGRERKRREISNIERIIF